MDYTTSRLMQAINSGLVGYGIKSNCPINIITHTRTKSWGKEVWVQLMIMSDCNGIDCKVIEAANAIKFYLEMKSYEVRISLL